MCIGHNQKNNVIYQIYFSYILLRKVSNTDVILLKNITSLFSLLEIASIKSPYYFICYHQQEAIP